MINKKLILVFIVINFLGACTSPTAMLGPMYTISSSGSVIEAGLSFSSNEIITRKTGKSPIEKVVVCDGLTLEQSQAGPALEMKEEIKKMVIQGMSDNEIKDHFVEKFGIEILANPPKKGFDVLVWLAPLVFGFLGIVLLYRYFFS